MRKRFKLTKKKECTVLTWPARIIVFIFVLSFSLLFFFRFPHFLSKNNPVNGEYLVIDGQVPDYSVQYAIELFNKLGYKSVITTGGKLSVGYNYGGNLTMAELTYSTFVNMNFDKANIVALPGEEILINRTYNSALTLKEYFLKNNITSAKVDIIAIGCHSRRSKLLFQMALGKNYHVGVHSVEDKSFSINGWWKTSKGVRTVLSETIAYFYVKLFFYPQK